MPNAAELFTEVIYKIAPPAFCAKLLTATGKTKSFGIYTRLFEDGKRGDYSVFVTLSDDKSIDYLKKLVRCNDLEVCYETLSALYQTEAPYTMDPLLDTLIELLANETNIVIRYETGKVIAKIGGIKAVKPMLEFLKKNQSGRDVAFFALTEIGALDTKSLLFEFCNIDISGIPSAFLISSLGKIKHSAGVNLLQEILQDEDVDLRRRLIASTTLAEIDDQKILEPILELLKNDNPNIRAKALIAIRGIRNPDTKLIQQLIGFLKDDNPTIRASAVFTLGKIGDSQVIGYIIDLLKDNDENVRISAANALELLGDPETIHPLIELLKNSDLAVQWAPASALARISTKAYDAVKDALLNAYHKNEINKETLIKVAEAMEVSAYRSIRNSKALVRYHLQSENKSFSCTSFLAQDDIDKVSECCKLNIKIGDEAIVILNENNQKESIHALSCQSVKAAYWS